MWLQRGLHGCGQDRGRWAWYRRHHRHPALYHHPAEWVPPRSPRWRFFSLPEGLAKELSKYANNCLISKCFLARHRWVSPVHFRRDTLSIGPSTYVSVANPASAPHLSQACCYFLIRMAWGAGANSFPRKMSGGPELEPLFSDMTVNLWHVVDDLRK